MKKIIENDVKYARPTNKKVPTVVYDIGLITIDGDDFALQTFVSQFKKRCSGNLRLYTLNKAITSDNNNQFKAALDYFDKKRVDMICVLSGSLNTDQLLRMSERCVVDKVLGMSKYTAEGNYMVSVHQTNPGITPPSFVASHNSAHLTSEVTNTHFNNAVECIDFIASIQNTFERKINNICKLFGGDLREKIVEMEYRHHQHNMYFMSKGVLPFDYQKVQPKNSVPTLYTAIAVLKKHIDREQNTLVRNQLSEEKKRVRHLLNPKVVEKMQTEMEERADRDQANQANQSNQANQANQSTPMRPVLLARQPPEGRGTHTLESLFPEQAQAPSIPLSYTLRSQVQTEMDLEAELDTEDLEPSRGIITINDDTHHIIQTDLTDLTDEMIKKQTDNLLIHQFETILPQIAREPNKMEAQVQPQPAAANPPTSVHPTAAPTQPTAVPTQLGSLVQPRLFAPNPSISKFGLVGSNVNRGIFTGEGNSLRGPSDRR